MFYEQLRPRDAAISGKWKADWHKTPPQVQVTIPCFHEIELDMSERAGRVTIESNHTCKQKVTNSVTDPA